MRIIGFIFSSPQVSIRRYHRGKSSLTSLSREHSCDRFTIKSQKQTPPKAYNNPSQSAIPSTTMPIAPSKLRAVLFDLDGTCVNSDHIHYEAYRDTILKLLPDFNQGQPITRQFYDQKMSGLQNPVLVSSLFPQLSLEEQTNLWQSKEILYEQIIEAGIDPIPGLIDLIDLCKKRGVQVFVVTNSPKRSCFKTMSSIGIKHKFGTNVVVAEECEHPKPDPAPYLKALKLAGVKAHEAIAFEDSPGGTHSATSAAILTIGITSTQTDQVLRTAGAAFTIPDYTSTILHESFANWMISSK